ncbi:hypothetical protein N3K66_000022 [Trichothecium roseum]|uniref:Uncharacterized protein n=1 Tax=Trichothecium roseum TaxID=47278 RepID=A0ACC0VBJ7_9HYPO|nr:hypothetical protein N3K66_000022 [Trichothecium roseum]
MAAIESPPKRKKLSSTPIWSTSMFNASDHRVTRSFSASVRGFVFSPAAANRSAFSCWVDSDGPICLSFMRSVFLDAVNGSAAIGTRRDGIMYLLLEIGAHLAIRGSQLVLVHACCQRSS